MTDTTHLIYLIFDYICMQGIRVSVVVLSDVIQIVILSMYLSICRDPVLSCLNDKRCFFYPAPPKQCVQKRKVVEY